MVWDRIHRTRGRGCPWAGPAVGGAWSWEVRGRGSRHLALLVLNTSSLCACTYFSGKTHQSAPCLKQQPWQPARRWSQGSDQSCPLPAPWDQPFPGPQSFRKGFLPPPGPTFSLSHPEFCILPLPAPCALRAVAPPSKSWPPVWLWLLAADPDDPLTSLSLCLSLSWA